VYLELVMHREGVLRGYDPDDPRLTVERQLAFVAALEGEKRAERVRQDQGNGGAGAGPQDLRGMR